MGVRTLLGSWKYATWNPADKAAAMVLSNGNLTAGDPATGDFSGVRSTIGKSSGKWYWETTGSAASYTNYGIAIGIGSSGQTLTPNGDLTNLEGSRAYYAASGNSYSPSTVFGASFANTDVLGFALDMDAGTLVVYKNNVNQGTLVSGLTGTIFAYTCMNVGGGSVEVIANFGNTAFTYAPPSGFNRGLFSS